MKKQIKKILREGVKRDQITRIAVFDFDGTAIDTPLKDDATMKFYKEKTGEDWPHKGWWGRPESLDMNIFDMKPIPSVYEAYKKERVNPNTLVVLLTGRVQSLAKIVEKVLAANGYTFDLYLYNMGGATLDSKLGYLDALIQEYKNVKSVALWDDRQEHVPSFKAWGSELEKDGISFEMTVVDSGHHGPQ